MRSMRCSPTRSGPRTWVNVGARDKFSWESIADQTVAVYRSVLEERAAQHE